MIKNLSLQQISQTCNLASNLITRYYKVDLMARFMEIKSLNPKLKQNQSEKELRCSGTTLQRYRQDIIMVLTYRIPPNGQKRKQKISNGEHDLERPQITSNDVKRPQLASKESSPNIKTVKHKTSNSKGGANIEINDKYSDEIFHNNNL